MMPQDEGTLQESKVMLGTFERLLSSQRSNPASFSSLPDILCMENRNIYGILEVQKQQREQRIRDILYNNALSVSGTIDHDLPYNTSNTTIGRSRIDSLLSLCLNNAATTNDILNI